MSARMASPTNSQMDELMGRIDVVELLRASVERSLHAHSVAAARRTGLGIGDIAEPAGAKREEVARSVSAILNPHKRDAEKEALTALKADLKALLEVGDWLGSALARRAEALLRALAALKRREAAQRGAAAAAAAALAPDDALLRCYFLNIPCEAEDGTEWSDPELGALGGASLGLTPYVDLPPGGLELDRDEDWAGDAEVSQSSASPRAAPPPFGVPPLFGVGTAGPLDTPGRGEASRVWKTLPSGLMRSGSALCADSWNGVPLDWNFDAPLVEDADAQQRLAPDVAALEGALRAAWARAWAEQEAAARRVARFGALERARAAAFAEMIGAHAGAARERTLARAAVYARARTALEAAGAKLLRRVGRRWPCMGGRWERSMAEARAEFRTALAEHARSLRAFAALGSKLAQTELLLGTRLAASILESQANLARLLAPVSGTSRAETLGRLRDAYNALAQVRAGHAHRAEGTGALLRRLLAPRQAPDLQRTREIIRHAQRHKWLPWVDEEHSAAVEALGAPSVLSEEHTIASLYDHQSDAVAATIGICQVISGNKINDENNISEKKC